MKSFHFNNTGSDTLNQAGAALNLTRYSFPFISCLKVTL